MRLLALDASTTAVGWAVFENGEYQESGVFVPKGDDWHSRLLHISDWLNDRLRLDDQIELVAYEVASGNYGNMATHRKLGAVEWLCWWVTDAAERYWLEINVQEVKASGCHKNALPIAWAISGGNLTGRRTGDEADAIGVALAAWAKLKKSAIKSATGVAK